MDDGLFTAWWVLGLGLRRVARDLHRDSTIVVTIELKEHPDGIEDSFAACVLDEHAVDIGIDRSESLAGIDYGIDGRGGSCRSVRRY
jgi:hypothetical protein